MSKNGRVTNTVRVTVEKRKKYFHRRSAAKVPVVLHFQCCWKFVSKISNTLQTVTKDILLMLLIFYFYIVNVGISFWFILLYWTSYWKVIQMYHSNVNGLS